MDKLITQEGEILFTLDSEFGGKKFEITPEGFLKVRAKVTRVGIFDYYSQDGKELKRLRLPGEIFDKASMDSLALKPITYQHPKGTFVNSENIKDFQIGTTGEIIEQDGEHVICTVIVTDKEAVQYILDKFEGGEDVQLSCGYVNLVLDTSGTHPVYGAYDQVQTKIRYNHLAIVDKGRAGSAELILDGQNKEEDTTMPVNFKHAAVKLKTFVMDAIDAEVPNESMPVIQRLSSKLTEAVGAVRDHEGVQVEAVKAADEAKAKVDQKDEKITELQAQVDELTDPNSAKFDKILTDAEEMRDVATALKVELKDAQDKRKTAKQIMIDVIAVKCKNGKFDPEGHSEDYLKARYDLIAADVSKDDIARDEEEEQLGEFLGDAGKKKEEDLSPYDKFVKNTADMHAIKPNSEAN